MDDIIQTFEAPEMPEVILPVKGSDDEVEELGISRVGD